MNKQREGIYNEKIIYRYEINKTKWLPIRTNDVPSNG